MNKPADQTAFAAALGGDLRTPKLSHLVASRLRGEIVSGRLKPGSALLPESKMLEIFDVSRPTLREALRVLEAEELIAVGRGYRTGAMVLGPNIHKAAEYATSMLVHEGVTMRDLHQARMSFEPAIIRSLKGAALKLATPKLRACIARMQTALAERRFLDVLAGTNRFHEELGRSSGNKTMTVFIGMLQTISDEAFAINLTADGVVNHSTLQRNMAKTVVAYGALCDLLEKGRIAEAATFWRRYMEGALDFLVRSKIGERVLVVGASGQ